MFARKRNRAFAAIATLLTIIGCSQPADPASQPAANADGEIVSSDSGPEIADSNPTGTENPVGPTEWKQVTFPDMKMSIELPTSGADVVNGTKFESKADGLEIGVNTMPLPQSAIDKLKSFQIGSIILMLDMHARLTNARNGAVKAARWTLQDSRYRFIQGHPAIDFTADDPRHGMIADTLGVVIDKERFVLIAVRTPRSTTDRSDARRILDSIQFQSSDVNEPAESEHAMTADELLAEFNADPQATYTKYRDIPLTVSGVVLRHRNSKVNDWSMREVLIAPDEHVKQVVRMRADPLNGELRIKTDASKVSEICCIMKADDPWSQAATGAKVTLRAYLNEPGMGFLVKLALSDAEFVETEHEIKPVITAEEISKRFQEDPEKLTAELGAHFMVIEGRAIDYELKIPQLSTQIFLEGADGLKLYCVTERKEKNPPKPGDRVRLYGEYHMLHEIDDQVLMQIRECHVISSNPGKE